LAKRNNSPAHRPGGGGGEDRKTLDGFRPLCRVDTLGVDEHNKLAYPAFAEVIHRLALQGS
jgi:hypothetical protein